MTNTPMSEREKELVRAATRMRELLKGTTMPTGYHLDACGDLAAAIRAYDPKPEKEYTMPEWEEFSKWRSGGWRSDIGQTKISERFVILDEGEITDKIYNAIREALSKPKAPTE